MSDAHDRKQAPTEHPGEVSSGAQVSAPTADESQQRTCIPCHGSGKVISNLGGHARKLICPWCRGGGVRLTGVDAQEWQQEQAAKHHR